MGRAVWPGIYPFVAPVRSFESAGYLANDVQQFIVQGQVPDIAIGEADVQVFVYLLLSIVLRALSCTIKISLLSL